METSHVNVNGELRELADGEIAISTVDPRGLELVWPEVAPWVCAALRKSAARELTAGMVYARLEGGEYLLLMAHSKTEKLGACVLGLRNDADGRPWVNVLALGGTSMARWIDAMAAAVKACARQAKAQRVVMVARLGWQRVLQKHGTQVHAQVLTCDQLEA